MVNSAIVAAPLFTDFPGRNHAPIRMNLDGVKAAYEATWKRDEGLMFSSYHLPSTGHSLRHCPFLLPFPHK